MFGTECTAVDIGTEQPQASLHLVQFSDHPLHDSSQPYASLGYTANMCLITIVCRPTGWVAALQMSLADLTRCHHEQEGRDPAATGLGNQRRVAFADESQEGINSLMSWAAMMVSKPDDIELQVLVLHPFPPATCTPSRADSPLHAETLSRVISDRLRLAYLVSSHAYHTHQASQMHVCHQQTVDVVRASPLHLCGVAAILGCNQLTLPYGFSI